MPRTVPLGCRWRPDASFSTSRFRRCAGCGSVESPLCPNCLDASNVGATPQATPHTPAGLGVVFRCATHRTAGGDLTPIAHLLLRFKVNGDRDAGRTLCKFFAEFSAYSAAAAYDWIVPVPAEPRRRRIRGFDQAGWMGRHLARRTASHLSPLLLQRSIGSRAQRGLGGRDRRRNLAGSFRCSRLAPDPPPKILLIDDVMTTGATLTACAAALHKAGYEDIDAAVLLFAEARSR